MVDYTTEKLPTGEVVEVETTHNRGDFIPEEGKIDRRHGDPEEGGLSSGEKASIARADRYGDELPFTKDPEKRKAAEAYAQEKGYNISESLAKSENK